MATSVSGPDEATTIDELKARLWDCCIRSLPRLYLEDAGILAEGLRWDGSKYEATTPSVRDTANVLVALYVLRSHGVTTPLDADRMLARCVERYLDEIEYPEIALLLWADALGDRVHQSLLWPALLGRFSEDASNTMLLSWTLSGVCEYSTAGGDRRSTKKLAGELYRKIAGNQNSRTGLFHASAAREGLLRRRRSTAHLPSQVFAVQALAQYSMAFGDRQAAARAMRCADRLRSLQGPRGEWWCVYDVRKGTVVQEYPVYSVHQDGSMATALGLLDRLADDGRFAEARDRGIPWLFGDNELATSMVDEDLGVVLRGIRREGGALGLLREMRTYHPGRCLYALAISDFDRDSAMTDPRTAK